MQEKNLTHKCNFSFKCSQQWDKLLPTKNSDRRFCNSCQRDVYYIDSEVDLIKARNNGNCVAVADDRAKLKRSKTKAIKPIPVVAGMLKPIVMGVSKMPSPVEDAERFLKCLQEGKLTVALTIVDAAKNNRVHYYLAQLCSQVVDRLDDSNDVRLKILINYLNSQTVSWHQFETLAIALADKGYFNAAIGITNAIYNCFDRQAKASCLIKIACCIANAGDASRAIELFTYGWHLSIMDSTLANNQDSSVKVMQSRTMTKIVAFDLETQIDSAIESTKLTNQILSSIPLQFQFNSLLI